MSAVVGFHVQHPLDSYTYEGCSGCHPEMLSAAWNDALAALPHGWVIEVTGPWLRGDHPPVFGAKAMDVPSSGGRTLLYEGFTVDVALRYVTNELVARVTPTTGETDQ